MHWWKTQTFEIFNEVFFLHRIRLLLHDLIVLVDIQHDDGVGQCECGIGRGKRLVIARLEMFAVLVFPLNCPGEGEFGIRM